MPYLTLDIGTSGCKALLVSEMGEIQRESRRSYPLFTKEKGQAELDPGIVARKAGEVLKEAAFGCRDIRAMAVTSLGESFVLLDKSDRVLLNSMTYLDQRGEDELGEIREKAGEKGLQILTGTPLKSMYSLPKYLWIRKHLPKMMEEAKSCLLYCDYMGYLLTGERVIDPTLASRTMLLDLKERQWNKGLIDRFGIRGELFSEVRETGSLVGKTRGNFLKELGLPQGVPLYNGCHDQISAMLGVGALYPGEAMAGEGSSESLQILLDGKELGRLQETILRQGWSVAPFAAKGLYALTLGQDTYGTCIRWFGDTFLPGEEEVYQKLEQLGALNSNGTLFLPFMAESGERRAGGVFLGLNVSTGIGQMYRALLEGLCLETKRNLRLLEGRLFSQVKATGGCTSSPVHMQLKADILECPISIMHTVNTGLMGLSMLCSVGRGDSRNLEEAARQFVQVKQVYDPQKSYQDQEDRYEYFRNCLRRE